MSESLDTEATMANAFPDLTPFQNSPVAAYIGGLPTDTVGSKFFINYYCLNLLLVTIRKFSKTIIIPHSKYLLN